MLNDSLLKAIRYILVLCAIAAAVTGCERLVQMKATLETSEQTGKFIVS